jgi:anti-sigma B factor antagonist
METSTSLQNDVTVVSVKGSIDALTAEIVTQALLEQVQAGVTQLVADLSEVDYTSSAGLRSILGALKEIRQNGGDLRLACLQPGVLKVLKLSGFTSIFKTYDDAAAAVASFR